MLCTVQHRPLTQLYHRPEKWFPYGPLSMTWECELCTVHPLQIYWRSGRLIMTNSGSGSSDRASSNDDSVMHEAHADQRLFPKCFGGYMNKQMFNKIQILIHSNTMQFLGYNVPKHHACTTVVIPSIRSRLLNIFSQSHCNPHLLLTPQPRTLPRLSKQTLP